MKIKIATFAFILKNPAYDKEQIVSHMTKKGFKKKYFTLGLMKAYRYDGTEIPTRNPPNEYSDKYQLRGEKLSVAFTGNDLLIHHKFGQDTNEISYSLQEYVTELGSIFKQLTNFLIFEQKEFELILVLRASSAKNPEKVFANWSDKLFVSHNNPSHKRESDKFSYHGIINDRCRTQNIMVRNNEYVIELRFESNDWKDLVEDFSNSEKIGTDIILDLEKEE